MIGLFTIVTLLALYRLNTVHDLMSSIVGESLPTVTHAASLNSQMQTLATHTAILSNAQSTPSRQVAKARIEEGLSRIIDSLLNNKDQREFLIKQLSILGLEVNELEDLVAKRIMLEEQLAENLTRFYDEALIISAKAGDRIEDSSIENSVMEILIVASGINNQSRLHELRRIEEHVISIVHSTIDSLRPSQREYQVGLEKLLIHLAGETGLINQKVESLRVVARTRGREGFVRNLIADAASSLQYHTQLVNQQAKSDAIQASEDVNKQTQLIIITGLFAVALTLLIIYYLYRRIVLRLLSLSTQVNNVAQNGDAEIVVDGTDEIASLAKNFSIYLKRVKEQEAALMEMTLSDALTSIPNRRAFDKGLSDAVAQSQRNQWCLTVMLIDIDCFKLYNDHYGHTDGDACLRLVANQLNSVVVRNTDFCARYGGEEFVCILPNTDAKGAKVKAEELRMSIEKMKIPHKLSTVAPIVTVSVGVATFPFNSKQNWMEDIIVEQADKALYQAKGDGRNQCAYFAVESEVL